MCLVLNSVTEQEMKLCACCQYELGLIIHLEAFYRVTKQLGSRKGVK